MTDLSNAQGDARSYRLTNIDMLRGLVIVIMAIDHCRDFFLVAGTPDPMIDPDVSGGLYFMRWLTHVCAPTFVFLAGTSVGLMSARKTPKELSGFVLKRGIWLILVDFFIIANLYTFTPFGDEALGGLTIMNLQVLWAMGISMIVLSGALYFGPKICLIIGAIILLTHNFLDQILPMNTMLNAQNGIVDPLWIIIHSQASVIVGFFYISFQYPLLPWIGVMLLGYGTAFIFEKPAIERDSFLRKSGLIMIGAFILIRLADVYGEPNHWQIASSGIMATILDFMNVSKYPPSLLFLLATLGPMAIFCSYAENWKGWLKDTLVMFGRVPFAFYVAHFLVIHCLSILFGMWQGFEPHQMVHHFLFYPEGYGASFLGVMVAWVVVVTTLYPFCKWMAKVKKTRKNWWLSYL